MELEDLGYADNWFESAHGKIKGNLEGGVNQQENDFGEGKTNSSKWSIAWKNKDYGENGTSDLWGKIQDISGYDLDSWFVPSKSELTAFGDMMDNYLGIQLLEKLRYFTSSLANNSSSNYWKLTVKEVFIVGSLDEDLDCYIRLSTKF